MCLLDTCVHKTTPGVDNFLGRRAGFEYLELWSDESSVQNPADSQPQFNYLRLLIAFWIEHLAAEKTPTEDVINHFGKVFQTCLDAKNTTYLANITKKLITSLRIQ